MFRRHRLAKILIRAGNLLESTAFRVGWTPGHRIAPASIGRPPANCARWAQEAKDPATKAELSWLAHSYDLLAAKVEHGEEHLAVHDGDRSLEIPARTA